MSILGTRAWWRASNIDNQLVVQSPVIEDDLAMTAVLNIKEYSFAYT